MASHHQSPLENKEYAVSPSERDVENRLEEEYESESHAPADPASQDAGGRARSEVSGKGSSSLRWVQSSKSTRSIAESLSPLHEVVFVATICCAQLMTQASLGQTLVLLHIIGDSFGITNPGTLSWLIAGYSLTVGTFILPAGRFGDVFGYKKMLLIGFLWFALWSMVAGLAVYSNSVLFIFARVLTGIGPAICLPNGLAVLGSTYGPSKKKNMAFAFFGATAPGGSVLGGAFAGVFALAWWPWAFWSFAIALVGLTALTVVAVPSPPPRVRESLNFRQYLTELDALGGIVGVTALILFNFAFNQAPIVAWSRAYIIVTLCLGAALFALFIYIEVHVAAKPLIPFSQLSSEAVFVLGCIALGWACFGVWVYYSYQFFQIIRHATPLQSVAWFVPVAAAGAAASIFTGILLDKLRAAWVMTLALLAFTVGSVLLGTAPVEQDYWYQSFWSMLIMPFGMDMSFPAATLLLSNAMPREHQGMAASLVNTVVNYSISLGLGFAGTIEVHVNRGGKTPEDTLFGYRASFWFGMGLAGAGLCLSLIFLTKTYVDDARAGGRRKDLDSEQPSEQPSEEDEKTDGEQEEA